MDLFSIYMYVLSGGNQRELARAKNLKKQQEQGKKKGGESGGALKERKERCAKFWFLKLLYRPAQNILKDYGRFWSNLEDNLTSWIGLLL